MDIKKLYADCIIMLESELAIYRFLLYLDMGVKELMAKYKNEFLFGKSAYITPQSLSDSLALREEFSHFLLLYIVGRQTSDKDLLSCARACADNVYINFWRENAKGKHRKGDVW